MTPVKKGMHGCLIAFLVFLALGVLGGAGVGLWFYFEFREYVGATAEMGELMVDAAKAPGASDVKAAGCEEAWVLDLAKFGKVMDRFEKESARRESRPAKPFALGATGFLVSCKVTLKSPPACADVAKAFIKSQKPATNVNVMVQRATVSHCEEEFDPSAKSLGTKTMPTFPTQ